MSHSVLLRTFALLCNHPCCPSLEILSSCKTKTPDSLNQNAHLPSSKPLLIVILLSVSASALLRISYKWKHTVFILLRLAYFTYHNGFKVHVCQNSLPFWGGMCSSHCMATPHLVYQVFSISKCQPIQPKMNVSVEVSKRIKAQSQGDRDQLEKGSSWGKLSRGAYRMPEKWVSFLESHRICQNTHTPSSRECLWSCFSHV